MTIIVHYAEIALKGGNRKIFEEKLVENIKKSLQINGIVFESIRRISGRILIELPKAQDELKIIMALRNVFGLAYFAFVKNCQQNIEAIKEAAAEILKNKNFNTFRIEARRSDKNFPLTSQQINEQIGAYVVGKLDRKVKLESPELTLFIELVEEYCFLYTEKITGLGGLPVGVNGKVVCLLSGGIDSPVAAFYIMKRGVEVVFVHCHTYPLVKDLSIQKVKNLVAVLNKFQFQSKLYLVPFGDIQKEIFQRAKPEFGCVLCKRLMLRIASEVAPKEKSQAIVTGDNLGQVASQTLDNLLVVSQATENLILRPLLCFDKEDIIQKAKEISTYKTSILPSEMYCSAVLPQHPATKTRLEEIKNEEKKIDIEKLIKEAVKKSKVECLVSKSEPLSADGYEF